MLSWWMFQLSGFSLAFNIFAAFCAAPSWRGALCNLLAALLMLYYLCVDIAIRYIQDQNKENPNEARRN